MPEFRFWGSRDPRGRVKPAVLAEAPSPGSSSDGVPTLRIYDPIDSWGDFWGLSAREFMDALDQVGDVPALRLHINSPGGEVYEAIAILNALRAHPARVTAVVDGLAASAASFVAAGVDELVMGRNTELMIHDAWGVGFGPASAMRDLAERLDQISDNIASIYADKAGTDVGDWRAAMLAETWYSADEAVTAGLADSVVGDDAAGELIAAAFDLSAFRSAGRQAAPAPVIRSRTEPPASASSSDLASRHARTRHRLVAARHGLA